MASSSVSASTPTPESVVVLGSGIVGLSTAYFLSLPPSHLSPSHPHSPSPSSHHHPAWHPPTIHLVDPSPTLFRATASGLAGGFLAKDWFAPPVAPLGALSFDLHRRLAEACGGKERWGWCESEGWSLDREAEDTPEGALDENGPVTEDMDLNWLMSGSSRATLLAAQQTATLDEPGSHPKWLRAPSSAFSAITNRASTAQVDPTRLCEFLLAECLSRGVLLHCPARATQLIQDTRDEPPAIRLEFLNNDESTKPLDIPCSTLILTAGAWTPVVYKSLFPHAPRVPRVKPLAGYSVLIQSPLWSPIREIAAGGQDRVCHAVFTSDRAGFSPEIFSRAGGEIWLGGLNAKHLPLPHVPTPLVLPSSSEAKPSAQEDVQAIETLKGLARQLCRVPSSTSSSPSSDLQFTRTSLCFRPVSPSGRPYVGPVSPSDLFPGLSSTQSSSQLEPHTPNVRVFMGTAHGPWGISLSLGTGWVLGEMVRGERTSVDVSALVKWVAQP